MASQPHQGNSQEGVEKNGPERQGLNYFPKRPKLGATSEWSATVHSCGSVAVTGYHRKDVSLTEPDIRDRGALPGDPGGSQRGVFAGGAGGTDGASRNVGMRVHHPQMTRGIQRADAQCDGLAVGVGVIVLLRFAASLAARCSRFTMR